MDKSWEPWWTEKKTALFSAHMDRQRLILIAILHVTLADQQMLKAALFCVFFTAIFPN